MAHMLWDSGKQAQSMPSRSFERPLHGGAPSHCRHLGASSQCGRSAEAAASRSGISQHEITGGDIGGGVMYSKGYLPYSAWHLPTCRR